MSRRPPPPPEYFEDEAYPMDRDAYPRAPRRRDRLNEDVEDRRRRRSMPPEEEMERMHISSQRPPPIPREYMRDSFAMPAAPVPPREPGPSMMMRKSREEVDAYLPGPDREDPYARPRRRRAHRPSPREVEDDVVFEEREVRGGGGRRVPPPRVPMPRDIDEEELIVEEREKRGGGGRRPRFDEDEISTRRRERAFHRGYDSEREMRPHERRGTRLEEEEMGSRSSKRGHRPRRRDLERDELLVDDPEPETRSVAASSLTDQRVMQWKDQPSPGEIEEDTRRERRSRRSPTDGKPPSMVRSALPGAFPLDPDEVVDDEVSARSRLRSAPIPGVIDDEEIAIRREERSLRRGSSERDEPVTRKSKRNSPQERLRTPEIVMPPVHEEARNIDEEYEPSRLPRAPSPEIPSAHGSFEEAEARHQSSKSNRRSRKYEEDISPTRREEDDESISPTSGPVEFQNPFGHGDRPRRRKPRSRGDSGSMAAGSSRSKGTRNMPLELDERELEAAVDERMSRARFHADTHPRDSEALVVKTGSRGGRDFPRGVEEEYEEDYDEDEELESYERNSRTRSGVNNHPRDSTDEWSVVHAPSKEEGVEMSGALDVVEIAPKDASLTDSTSEGDDDEGTEESGRAGTHLSKENKDERWTEITKDLVVREAIERIGYEFEETRVSYYIFSYLEPHAIDELVELSDAIRKARRRRIREMQRERATIPPRPASLIPDPTIPRPRYGGERRVRTREWIVPPPYH